MPDNAGAGGRKSGEAAALVVGYLAFFIGCFCGIGLFLYKQWDMLLAEAEGAPAR
jgi:hypothetical protein